MTKPATPDPPLCTPAEWLAQIIQVYSADDPKFLPCLERWVALRERAYAEEKVKEKMERCIYLAERVPIPPAPSDEAFCYAVVWGSEIADAIRAEEQTPRPALRKQNDRHPRF